MNEPSVDGAKLAATKLRGVNDRNQATATNGRSILNDPFQSVRRAELLSPAGDWDCVRAAIENGADAIYFGLDCGFNARARAANFPAEDLPRLLETMHRQGVKGYVTLNTLVFSGELEDVARLIVQVARAGADAVLVQDLGVVRLIREICPSLPIHASTQMTLTSAECINAVAALGIERVVLARELSIREIRKIHERTKISLEAFVHGALCVAYSGQCLTSESLGGRSANRGQCAQACRLPYDLTCDGREVALGHVKYLLSPQDLAAHALVPELLEAGIDCFKIEGRLKTPEYVANITRHYRAVLDAALAGERKVLDRDEVEAMELSFSRGFAPGWLHGCDHKMLVPGLNSAKRGVVLGQVEAVRGSRVVVRLEASVATGDGVVFAGDRAAGEEQGGRVYQVFARGESVERAMPPQQVELAFQWHRLDLAAIHPGQAIWKTDDPRLTRRLRATFSSPDPVRRVPLDVRVAAAIGQPLRVEANSATGIRVALQSDAPLEPARKHPLTEQLLREQFSRLGGSCFELRSLDAEIQGQPMAPLSVLGRLRHELRERLEVEAGRARALPIVDERPLERLRAGERSGPDVSVDSSADPVLRVLCRSLPQLESVLAEGIREVYVDFQDIREYRKAVARARAAEAAIFLATPRIQKPDEVGIFRVLLRHGADGILVRNLAGLAFHAAHAARVVADYALNAANPLTVAHLRQAGAERVTPSYDLNRQQLLELVSATCAVSLEVVIHQHMPMFHMEHCVFCAVLSPGTNKTNCGRPCDRHEVKLRDRIGMEHPLRADVGCRNTLFNAVPQSSAEVVPELLARGVRAFRVELLENGDVEIRRTVSLYRELLAGAVSGSDVWRELRAANRVGVTRGTLEPRRDPLAIV